MTDFNFALHNGVHLISHCNLFWDYVFPFQNLTISPKEIILMLSPHPTKTFIHPQYNAFESLEFFFRNTLSQKRLLYHELLVDSAVKLIAFFLLLNLQIVHGVIVGRKVSFGMGAAFGVRGAVRPKPRT
jgi:hypothetical protein